MSFLLWGEPGVGAVAGGGLGETGRLHSTRAFRSISACSGRVVGSRPSALPKRSGPHGRDYLRTKRGTFPVDFWTAEVSTSGCGVNLAGVFAGDGFIFWGLGVGSTNGLREPLGLPGSADCRCRRSLWGEPAVERAHSQNGAGRVPSAERRVESC